MSLSWIFLLSAGLFEIAWPVGLKISQTPGKFLPGLSLAIVGLALSGWLLWLAQKEIPLGTAYAVWTGIGAAGTFLVGAVFFGDPAGLTRWLAVLLIVSGVALLKFAR